MHAENIDAAITTLITETMAKGGDTRSLIGEKLPQGGYMVGGLTDSLIFGSDILNPAHENVVWNMIIRWVNERFEIATTPNAFIGSWIDTETGSVYIDISEWIEHKDSALDLATTLEEIAIWDLANEKEIRV